MENLIFLIVAVLSLIGVFGSIIPALPGPALSFISLLILYFFKGENFISEKVLIVIGISTALVLFFVNLIPIASTRITGASKFGAVGSMVGIFIGIFLFPPFGVFFGAILGAIIGELYAFNDAKKAIGAGIGTVIGIFFGLFIQLIFSLSIFLYIILKIFSIY